MATLKRKRSHRDGPEAAETGRPATSVPAPTRRATRQTSIPPRPVLPDPEPRRRRRGADSNERPEPQHSRTELARGVARGKENIPMQTAQKAPPKPTRATRQNGFETTGPAPPGGRPVPSTSTNGGSPHIRPNYILAPATSTFVTPSASTPTRSGPSARHAAPVMQPHTHTVGHSKPLTIATSSPHATGSQQQHQRQQQLKPTPDAPATAKAGGSDRNIDKVVLGNICFRAWYPSYYGKEVLGDVSGSSTKSGNGSTGQVNGDIKEDATHKVQGRRGDNQPVLDRLYVCPCCFKYSKELVTWWDHVRVCERQGFVPGQKIYVHPKGTRTRLVPAGPAQKFLRGKRGSIGSKMVEETVQDEGEWSIWEVDGEKEMLFCQNLSLFAKLFLDNKSVFFDVTGFNYFLLVHTPPAPPPDPTSGVAPVNPPHRRIVGFFSKEKMSWDNNNLACILIFPPWQRKGLGSLLMGVSYEISRREGVLGGPEKPISDLGKKGYKRFWAGEIARWILGLELNGTEGETIVDVEECSEATWIAPEDCLLVLREMGIVEDGGLGPLRPKKSTAEEEVAEAEQVEVPRVCISTHAVRKYIEESKIVLTRTCDPDGFVESYSRAESVTRDEET